jgi:ketosteroid isomerase-like protein
MSALDSRASGVDAVRGFFDLFLAGKVDEAAQKYLANDFVLVNLLPDPIPFGGRYEGAAGFERYVSQIFAAIEMESFVVDAIFGQGESVAVIGSETSLVRSTGRRYEMDWVHVFRVSDGRIHSMREYNDTARMLAAFQDRP